MSATLCDSYHIGRLAAYLANKRAHNGSTGDTVAHIATALAASNIASIRARYPDTVDNFENAPGVVSECTEGPEGYVALCRIAARAPWLPLDRDPAKSAAMVAGAVQYFDYQSCEAGSTWRDSEGFRVSAEIAYHATRDLMRLALGNNLDSVHRCLEPATASRTPEAIAYHTGA